MTEKPTILSKWDTEELKQRLKGRYFPEPQTLVHAINTIDELRAELNFAVRAFSSMYNLEERASFASDYPAMSLDKIVKRLKKSLED